MSSLDCFGNLRVLDLAGPSGTLVSRFLADLGADVIKVESPDGDPMRQWPPVVGDPTDALSAPFIANNVNKRSITLNVADARGQALLGALIETATIVVDTSQSDTSSSRRIGYQDIVDDNPSLIWVSITPYGLSGPKSGQRASDLGVQAAGGLMYLAGPPNGPPVAGGGRVADKMGAYTAAAAIVFALFHQIQTGEGQLIEVSVQEAVAAQLEWASVEYAYDSEVPRRNGRLHPSVYPVALFEAADGWISLTVGKESHWNELVEWIGDDRLRDPDFVDGPARLARREFIDPIIAAWVRTQQCQYLFDEGQRRRIPIAPCLTPAQVPQNPHLAHRGAFHHIMIGDDTVPIPAFPVTTRHGRPALQRSAPAPGESNFDVYRGELKIDQAEFDDLRNSGII